MKIMLYEQEPFVLLADIAGEKAVEPIGDVLLNDVDHLVRHEAAFSPWSIRIY